MNRIKGFDDSYIKRAYFFVKVKTNLLILANENFIRMRPVDMKTI